MAMHVMLFLILHVVAGVHAPIALFHSSFAEICLLIA